MPKHVIVNDTEPPKVLTLTDGSGEYLWVYSVVLEYDPQLEEWFRYGPEPKPSFWPLSTAFKPLAVVEQVEAPPYYIQFAWYLTDTGWHLFREYANWEIR